MKIRCLKCNDIIESMSLHDCRDCKCGACHIDGGTQYTRIGGDPKFINLVYEDGTEKNLEDNTIKKEDKHKSFMREMYNTANNISYKSINNLENAKKTNNAYVIFEGDDGGTIYLTCPANLVMCEENDLEDLLEYIDKLYWNDFSMASICYEVVEENQKTIAGGMGGAVLKNEIWIHPEILKFNIEEKIKDTIYLSSKLVEIDLKNINTKNDCFRMFEKCLDMPKVNENWDSLYDWLTDLSWIKSKNIILKLYNYSCIMENNIQESKIFKELIEDVQEFWNNISETEVNYKKVHIKIMD